MRGRTNIGTGGMAINGVVKQFRVEEGKTITAGDFVNYQSYSVSDVFTLISSKKNVKNAKQIEDNIYAVSMGNELYLIEYDGERSEILSLYNDHVINSFDVLSDSSIICSVKAYPYVVRLKKIGNALALQNYTSENTEVINSIFCFVYRNVFCVLDLPDTSVPANPDLRVHFYDISNDYDITYNSTKIVFAGGGEENYIKKPLCNFAIINNEVYYIGGLGGDKRNVAYHLGLYRLNIDFNTYNCITSAVIPDLIGNVISVIPGNYESFSGFFEACNPTPAVIDNKYYIVFWGNYVKSESDLELYAYVCNIVNKTVSVQSMASLGFDKTKTGALCSNTLDNDKFLVMTDKQSAILKLNYGTLITQSNIYNNPLHYDDSIGGSVLENGLKFSFIAGEDDGVKGINLQTNMDYSTISEVAKENIVQPWETKADATGVAKQSGVAGEIIEVYVPQ